MPTIEINLNHYTMNYYFDWEIAIELSTNRCATNK